MLYPPAKVDRVLHDGETVSLGGTVLTARLTPGHTKGCTTWTMKVVDDGKSYDVVIVGSPNVNPGYKLVNNEAYPQIASDYEKGFRRLRSLHCDVFLGAHGDYYDMPAKYARIGKGTNPFIDPEGYRKYDVPPWENPMPVPTDVAPKPRLARTPFRRRICEETIPAA
jgi:metallo-beta-lactamase class B